MKWSLNSHSSLTLDTSYWKESRESVRILNAAGNSINIIVDEENQLSSNLIYLNNGLFDDTELSIALGHKNNNIKNAYRVIRDAAGNEILNAPLLFGFKSRHITSMFVDGKTTISNGDYILRYGFRFDEYGSFGGQFSPRLGLIKKLDDTSVFKLLYGNAFRAPTANELFGAPLIPGNLDLDAETIDTYEFVYLKQDSDSKTEVVLFFTNWENEIIVDAGTYNNVSRSKSYGIEASYIQKINNWLIDINASVIESEDTTDELEYSIFPDYIMNLATGYQFNETWVMQMNNRILIGLTKNPDTTTIKAQELKNYWRLDLNVTRAYENESEFYISIRNLLNRDNQLPSTGNSASQDDFIGGLQDEEISLDIGFRYKF